MPAGKENAEEAELHISAKRIIDFANDRIELTDVEAKQKSCAG